MKKLITIIALLICTVFYGQNEQFLQKVNKTNVKKAQIIADEIASESPTEYKLLQKTERADNIKFVYIPTSLNEADFLENMMYEKALIIDFKIDHFIPGETSLKLNSIKANYNDVFIAWKKYFKSTAEIEKTVTDYSSKKSKGKNYYFRLTKEVGYESNIWTIKNHS